MTARLVSIVVVAVILAGCQTPAAAYVAPSAPPTQPDCAVGADPEGLCIVVLGDSIGAGAGAQGDDRWWVRLRAALSESLPDRQVVVDDWAVSGSRIDVLEAVARDQTALAGYDIAIVIEGVNDELVTPLDEWRPRYEAAIVAIERQGPTVIVGTPPPGFENGAFITRYDPIAAALRDVAGDRRPLMDIAGRWLADGPAVAAPYYVDIIHQSQAGQVVMADLAREVVLDAIADD